MKFRQQINPFFSPGHCRSGTYHATTHFKQKGASCHVWNFN